MGNGASRENISEKEVINEAYKFILISYSVLNTTIQNIGVTANFPLKLTQLEINYHSIFILAHLIFAFSL